VSRLSDNVGSLTSHNPRPTRSVTRIALLIFYLTNLQMCTNLYNLKQLITIAGASADEDMFRCVWNELDCRINTCPVTKAHT
jgi:hypothetical protein